MHFEGSIIVHAPAERAWEVYRDVVGWPRWTASITSVELLDPGPLRVGQRARVHQPKLPVAVWTVTELTEGRHFSWMSTARGLRTTGAHVVTPTADGSCRVTAIVDQEGPLGWLVAMAYRRLTNRYLDWETAGLKRFVEAGVQAVG